jgi:PmbA protein
MTPPSPTAALETLDDVDQQTRLLGLAEGLLAKARPAGADAADVIAVSGRSISVSCRLGKIVETDRADGDSLGLRVFVGRRQAVVSSNLCNPAEFAELAERAVAMARAAPEDPYCGLADPQRLAKDWPALDILDGSAVGADDLADLALASEDAGRAVSGITNSDGASASWSLGGIALATSDGFRGFYSGTGFSISCALLAGEGTAMERDYEYETRAHLADLPAADEIGRKAAERTLRRLGARKLASCKVAVIYEPRTATSLVGHLLSAVSGTAIARKTSFLKDKLDAKVFKEGIRIIDDPLRPRGLRSRPFDAEGVAAAPLDLVSDGILQSWLMDSASARELGLATTGHARRGVSGPPAPGPSNCHLAAGAVSPDDLIKSVKQGLYVTELIGFGVNGVTGDYSRGASGLWIENGELAFPVSEVTIAGNLNDIFAGLTPADDLVFRRAVNAPTVLVEGMTLAGR